MRIQVMMLLLALPVAVLAQDAQTARLVKSPEQLLTPEIGPTESAPVFWTESPLLMEPSRERAERAAGMFDNLSFFGGLDGSKGPEDFGANAHFGYRVSAQWGLPLVREIGLGLQIGTAINHHQGAVGVFPALGGPDDRTQSFTTIGLFNRFDCGFNIGLAYDYLHQTYYDDFDLGQWRAQVGYQFTPTDELGAWGTWSEHGASPNLIGNQVTLRPIMQASLFWKHIWRGDIYTKGWVGVAEEHNSTILVLPGQSTVHHPVLFGSEIYVPLSDWIAIFGEASFITPTDNGTVTATLGIAFFPGKSASRATTSRFAPYLNTANNPTFSVDGIR